jgi:hypothetical protein
MGASPGVSRAAIRESTGRSTVAVPAGIDPEVRAMANEVDEGDRYRCPVEGCGCEMTVARAPDMEPTQGFVDCCGHRMEKAA